MITENLLNIVDGLTPVFLSIGIFTLSIGVFVTGMKFMFWSIYELDKIVKRYKRK